MGDLVDRLLNKLSDPADDLVVLDHAVEILQERGYLTTASAVAGITMHERSQSLRRERRERQAPERNPGRGACAP